MARIPVFTINKIKYRVDDLINFVEQKQFEVVNYPLTEQFISRVNLWTSWGRNIEGGRYISIEKFLRHIERLKSCDMDEPIIMKQIEKDDGPREYIMDGFHRVVRAFQEQRSSIKAFIIPLPVLEEEFMQQYEPKK